jgi:predicted AlkP superfamily phosphohydrolase/phosphomutase|nr:alkaline phosphatase family protein [Candidatus Krumholzibacteria bacterium]
MKTVFLAVVLACVVWSVGGCGGTAESPDPEARKLLIIGIDSADWRLLRPMVEEGRLPHLKGFMDQSTHGRMKTFFPFEKSPLLWASISTGVKPEVHGVLGMVKGSNQEPVRGSAWYAPALWDIIGAADLSTSLVGMWTTYPARPINGVMVSDYLPYGSHRDKPLEGLVYPAEMTDAVVAQRVDPASLTDEELSRFIDPEHLAAAKEKYPREVEQLREVWASDLSYLNVNRLLAQGDPYDLFFFYLRGPDMISHHFYKYLAPEKGHVHINEDEGQFFAHVVERYYEWADEVTGEVLGWFPPDRQAVILSDHGFYGPRKSGQKGSHEHSEWGIFLVRSPLYQADYPFSHLELLDICPTFLALMGLPAAQDMPGVVLTEGLTPEGQKKVEKMEKQRVPSYQPLRPAAGPEGEVDPGVDEEIKKQLRSLGYI